MRWSVPVIIVIGVIAANVVGIASGQDTKTWKVKVTNLTAGQPFSPPLWAVHDEQVDLWSEGEPATNVFALIAEDALNAPMEGMLAANEENVRDSGTALPPPARPPTPPPILPGGSREFEIETSDDAERLSMVWMLVRTNDGFAGLDSITLDGDKDMEVIAYDAGTEKNNEKGDFIPGPPFANFFDRDHDGGLIAEHPGIVLGDEGDLDGFKWEGPVARIEIEEE